MPNPDVVGREKILRVHMKKVPLAPDVDPKVIARGTPGFSGADLANLVNEAALLAARRNKRLVTQAEFEDSKDKVMMGAERKTMAMTEEEKLATAYHEAGHAHRQSGRAGNDPLHKVTIIPRGRALGVTMSLPERDRLSYSKQWCEGKIAMAFGGRVAEQIIYGREHLNTGASSDISQATSIAKRMVTEWGMSDKLGPLLYSENQQEVFLGHSITQQQNMSEETAKLIDEEMRRIVTAGEKTAWEVLTRHKPKLEAHGAGADGIRDDHRRRVPGDHARRQDRSPQRRRRHEGSGWIHGSNDRPAAAPARRVDGGRSRSPSRSRRAKRLAINRRAAAITAAAFACAGNFAPMKRSIYLQPTAIFWDRTERRAVEETDIPVWKGLPLAGGRLSFAALDVLTRASPATKRRTIVLGDAFSGDWGREALAAADILQELSAQSRAALRVCRSTGRASWASST